MLMRSRIDRISLHKWPKKICTYIYGCCIFFYNWNWNSQSFDIEWENTNRILYCMAYIKNLFNDAFSRKYMYLFTDFTCENSNSSKFSIVTAATLHRISKIDTWHRSVWLCECAWFFHCYSIITSAYGTSPHISYTFCSTKIIFNCTRHFCSSVQSQTNTYSLCFVVYI